MSLSITMKTVNRTIVSLVLAFAPLSAVGSDVSLDLSCEDFGWSDVDQLVQPYLSDDLYTSLVMQGQSAEYRPSIAAAQAMDDTLPEPVKRILQAIIDKNC